MTDAFADWDAAYLIGALSPAERAQFEEHLGECPSCRTAVAELAPTAGLLSRVPASVLLEGEDLTPAAVPAPVPDVAPRAAREALIRRVRRSDRRRLGVRVGLVTAGFAVIAAAIVVPISVWGPSAPTVVAPSPSIFAALPPAEAMTPVTRLPLTASVRLVGVGWGTRIDLSCRYTSSYGASDAVYSLAVVDENGAATQLSTWRVVNGADAHISAGTALDAASIRSVQIRDESGAVIMTYSP
ncbi:anti-sigma factor family protein [Microbacterium sp. ASV49]|uniref:Zf-HC2 domain-containing protein n=1 Tax=Microbacterium candidum TaxID=3041922 RepID=A0ABT7N244_9MICO|nr:zf-HC2 domain-containing protein [Microbacterium sp. ASV49]MDL9980787.1 zf-HC2 domain-containing protein [Microbacterium sp. ASV49]